MNETTVVHFGQTHGNNFSMAPRNFYTMRLRNKGTRDMENTGKWWWPLNQNILCWNQDEPSIQQRQQCVSMEPWPEWLLPLILQSPYYATVQWILRSDSPTLTTSVLHWNQGEDEYCAYHDMSVMARIWTLCIVFKMVLTGKVKINKNSNTSHHSDDEPCPVCTSQPPPAWAIPWWDPMMYLQPSDSPKTQPKAQWSQTLHREAGQNVTANPTLTK